MAREPCEIADLARCSLQGCEDGAWTGVITTLGFLVAFAIERAGA